MDIGAFVNENRKWLIGLGIGLLVYLIAYAVIGSIYDSAGAGNVREILRSVPQDGIYERSHRDAAFTESEELAAEKKRLQQGLAFARGAAFQLPAGAVAGDFLFKAGTTVKRALLNGASERLVQVEDKNIGWSVQTSVDEIRRVLFGLELLDEAAKRLFDAHDAARAADPEAVGLRAILQLRTESKQASRQPFRGNRRGEVVLTDHVVQERLQFKFEADAATVAGFFEACRKPGRTLVLEGVQMQQPGRIGDPVIVQGSLSGIAFKE